MKISSANWNITNTENLYKNIKEKLSEKTDIERQSPQTESLTIKSNDNKSVRLDSVLTEKEITTLQALFGEEKNQIDLSFYGRNKPKNVHSGFFLDIKG